MKLIQLGNICVFKIVAAEQEGVFVLLTDFPTELALYFLFLFFSFAQYIAETKFQKVE